jgi:hypothetical protein
MAYLSIQTVYTLQNHMIIVIVSIYALNRFIDWKNNILNILHLMIINCQWFDTEASSYALLGPIIPLGKNPPLTYRLVNNSQKNYRYQIDDPCRNT